MTEISPRQLKQIQQLWMQWDGVVAVGMSVSQASPCIKVYFSDPVALENAPVPEQVDGVHVVKVVSGEIEPQS